MKFNKISTRFLLFIWSLSLLFCLFPSMTQAQCSASIVQDFGNICNAPIEIRASVSSNSSCDGNSPCSESYEWTGPNNTTYVGTEIMATVTGEYCLEFTDCNCCSDNYCVTIPGSLSVSVSNTGPITCINETVQLSTSVSSADSYEWTGPNGFTSTEENPTISEPGTYTVTATKGGCSESGSTTVMEDLEVGKPDASPSYTLDCNGGAQLFANIVSAESYYWVGPNDYNSTETNPTISEDGIYILYVRNGQCEIGAGAFPVFLSNGPNIAPDNDGPLTCNKETVQLLANATEATSYEWTGPNGFSSSEENPIVSEVGTYNLTAYDDSDCPSTGSTMVSEVVILEDVNSSVSSPINCSNETVQLFANAPQATSFVWTGPNDFISTEANPLVSETGTYILTAFGTEYCNFIGQVTVTEDFSDIPIALPSVSGDITCSNGSVQLFSNSTNASNATIYNWTGPNGFTSNEANPTVSEEGTYNISVANGSCQGSTAALFVNSIVTNGPTVAPDNSGVLTCTNTSVQLFANATDAASYNWSGPNGFTSNEENPIVSEAGTYTLTAYDNGDCSNTGSTTVNEDVTNCIYDLALITTLAEGQNDTIQFYDSVDFKITVANQGELNSGNFTVVSQLQDNMTFMSASNGGLHNNGTITWNLSNLAANESLELLFTAEITFIGNSTYTAWAEIVSDDGDDIDSTPDTNTGEGEIFPNDLVINHNDISFNDVTDEDDNDFESVFLGAGVNVHTRVYLQGATVGVTADAFGNMTMRDDLRQGSMVPVVEPYSSLSGFGHTGDGGGESVTNTTYNQTGETALVDWLIIDLRDTLNPAQILSTRSALVLRNGEVVDVDGVSPVSFPSIEHGHYHVSVRHRNHLGVMTADPVYLSPDTNDAIMIDFTDATTETYGDHAQVEVQGRMALWAGDVNSDGEITYQGDHNETNNTFFDILTADENTGTDITFIHQNYGQSDTDLNCDAIFQGDGNDINLHFFNVINHPDNPEMLTNFRIVQQIPK